MVNRYIEFVKAYSKKNNMSYSCALCDIKTKGLYTPLKQLKKNELKENDEMGMEDFDAPNVVKIKKQVKKQQQTKPKNKWVEFVKKFSIENNLPYNVALKEARQFYN